MNLPNELLHIILCDVLGTYVHCLVLLPPGSSCWHAHRNLRSVSKHFKDMVDCIWDLAVGSENNWDEIWKLRVAISCEEYNGPGYPSVSPLLRAYGAYIVALILQENQQADVEKARVAYYNPVMPVGRSSESWFRLAFAWNRSVKPPEFGYILEDCLNATVRWECVDSILRLVEFMPELIRVTNGAEEDTLRLQTALGDLERMAGLAMPRLHQIKYRLIADLKDLVKTYHSSNISELGDPANNSAESSHLTLAASVKSFTQLWSKENEAAQIHKAAMHRAVSHIARQENVSPLPDLHENHSLAS